MKMRMNSSVGSKIDGIIKEYKVKAGENVKAGEFVEFLNDYIEKVVSQQLNTIENIKNINAVLLNENQIFITYTDSTFRLLGIVCTINNNLISLGEETYIFTQENGAYKTHNLVVLDDNKVLVLHGFSSYQPKLYGVVCTINGMEILHGVDTQISTIPYSGTYASATLLSNNKVFIVHGSTYNPYGVICTIEDTTITLGNSTLLYSSTFEVCFIRVLKINDNKIYVNFALDHDKSSSVNCDLVGMICTVENTTITDGTPIYYTSTQGVKGVSMPVAISESKIVIIYPNNAEVIGAICTINNTEITLEEKNNLITGAYSDGISAVSLGDNKVFVTYSPTTDSQINLKGIICTIEGTKIKIGKENLIDSSVNVNTCPSMFLLSQNKIFIAHHYGGEKNLGCSIVTPCIDNIQPLKSKIKNSIGGVAKTGGTDTVKVYIPNI